MSDMLGRRKYETATCEIRYSQAIPFELRMVVREVFNVKTESGMKGKGQGSKLMQAVIEEADKAQKILILLPDTEKLELWYSKYGFELVQTNPAHLMMRKPVEMTTRGTYERK